MTSYLKSAWQFLQNHLNSERPPQPIESPNTMVAIMLADKRAKEAVSNRQFLQAREHYQKVLTLLKELSSEKLHFFSEESIHLAITDTFVQEEDYPQAVTAFNRFLRAYPQNITVYERLGVLLMKLGDEEAAGDCFSQAELLLTITKLRNQPIGVTLPCHQAWLYLLVGDSKEAFICIKRAEKRQKNMPYSRELLVKVLVTRGMVYYMQGLHQQATQDFNATIKLEPYNKLAYVGLSLATLEGGSMTRAIDIWTTLVAIDPAYQDVEALDIEYYPPLHAMKQAYRIAKKYRERPR
jgi:tetratricopeptide (TPR) repeat protein